MSDKKISALPVAGTLGGTEIVPVVKGGTTKRTTTADIAALGGGGGGGLLPWTQIGVNADMPVETYLIINETDTVSQVISPDDYTQSSLSYVAASAGSIIQSVLLTAWAPRSISLVRLHITKLTDDEGTFLAMPGSYSVQYFISNVTFNTVALSLYPAVAVSGIHFHFADTDNSDYNSTGSVVTIKNSGHYRMGVDVRWLAP